MKSFAGWLLVTLSCSAQLPAPGTPAADRACESLRLTVDAVRRHYPGGDSESWMARTSFLLQAREYDAQLECPRLEITDEELYR